MSLQLSPSSPALRAALDDDCSCADVDVRRCRFIDAVLADIPPPVRLVGDRRESVEGTMLVVDDLGRFVDEAIFGRVEAVLRDVLCGAPDARFLREMTSISPSETAPSQ